MKIRYLISVLVFAALGASVLMAANNPKREFRGAWFPTVVNTTWKNMTTDEIKADIISNLDLFKKLNINAVIFQVRPQADALFVSQLEPWSRFITGTQGKAPEPFFDPAQFVLDECHKRGMEFHAWFNPYRVTSGKNEILASDHMYFKQPELFLKYGPQIYFDPGRPGSREHLKKVVADFVTRYDVDAIHFDDYFYPYKLPYLEFPDEESFLMYYKSDGFGRFDKNNWRRNNVNILVKELNETIKSIKPWVKFGISPFGVWRNDTVDPNGSPSTSLQTNYDDLYADILLWTKNGWIDYNAPQLYWEIGHSRVNYAPLVKWWSNNSNGVNLYIGQSIWNQLEIKNRNGDLVNQLFRKMEIVGKDPNIMGNIWWSGLGFASQPKLVDSLENNYQKYPSLMPQYKNIDTIPPKPVSEIKYSKGFLSWKAPAFETEMDRAVYYVVYKFGSGEIINIQDPSKIVSVVRDVTRFRIDGKRGFKYVVTALDRLQNESSPSNTFSR
ncbi:MAG: hypothetical protein ACD_77C00342G0018 [uncultured bacterium]|nr:MAG: hypothetical protein ACD_77C00342G0018 [uncultured bacterium]